MTSLDRRDFLKLGLVAGPASLVAGCGWDGGPFVKSSLETMSLLYVWVGENMLQSSNRLARVYPATASISTMPAYYISLLGVSVMQGRFASAGGQFDVLMHVLFAHTWTERTLYSLSPPFWTIGIQAQS